MTQSGAHRIGGSRIPIPVATNNMGLRVDVSSTGSDMWSVDCIDVVA